MRLLRVIMLWWMVLALPMQGMAAAAMLHCGAAGAPVPASSPQQAHHDGIHHAAPEADAAHAAHAHHAADAEGSAPAFGHDAGHAAGHACSACAACCVAMGLPAGMPVLATAPAATTAVTALVAPAPSFLTAGPERPPRSQRA